MPKWDATNSNNSNRISRTFKDLDLDFGLNSVTKDVNKLTDAEAIKRSVRNLVQTNHFDRPFHPELGCGVRDMLFENYTPMTGIFMRRKIVTIPNIIKSPLKNNISPDLDSNVISMLGRLSYQKNFHFYEIPININLRKI